MPRDEQNQNQDAPFLDAIVELAKADMPPAGSYDAARRSLGNTLAQDRKERFIMTLIKQSQRPALRWATGTGLVLLVAVVALVYWPLGRNSASALADPAQVLTQTAQQISQAQIIKYDVDWTFQENQPPIHATRTFKMPSSERIEIEWKGAHAVQIFDYEANKGILLLPDSKSYIALEDARTDRAGRPISPSNHALNLSQSLQREIAEVGDEATGDDPSRDRTRQFRAIGEQSLAGRSVTGYRRLRPLSTYAQDSTYWIDPQSKALVEVERPMNGMKFLSSNFQFDLTDLEGGTFSATPPTDYHALVSQTVTIYPYGGNNGQIRDYLVMATSMVRGHRLPQTLNPMEILVMQQQGQLDESSMGSDELQKTYVSVLQNAEGVANFLLAMSPDTQWRYDATNVTLGEAHAPLFWFKFAHPIAARRGKDGQAPYNVIWADFHMSQESDLKPVQPNNPGGVALETRSFSLAPRNVTNLSGERITIFTRDAVTAVKTFLYAKDGESAAAKVGRILTLDASSMQMTVVDTPENLDRVAHYLNSLPEIGREAVGAEAK